MLKTIKNKVLDLIYPPYCFGCGKIGSYLCSSCRDKALLIREQSCPFCNRITPKGKLCPSCRGKYNLTGVVSFAYFKDPVIKSMIHSFKYEEVFHLGETFGEDLAALIEREGIKPDMIAFIPMTNKKERIRGYNQGALLARRISEVTGYPTLLTLKKVKDTKTQVGLKRKERERNLDEAFECAGDIKGKKVIIVDDVLTTGTTLDKAAKALRRAGAREVWGVVLARE